MRSFQVALELNGSSPMHLYENDWAYFRAKTLPHCEEDNSESISTRNFILIAVKSAAQNFAVLDFSFFLPQCFIAYTCRRRNQIKRECFLFSIAFEGAAQIVNMKSLLIKLFEASCLFPESSQWP